MRSRLLGGHLRGLLSVVQQVALVFCLSLLAASGQSAWAQDYPSRTVRVIIPFTAGGAPDVLFRLVAQALSEKWGHGVIIENRPGGNTVTGTLAAVRSAPDGYTLLFTAPGPLVINQTLYSKGLPYDPAKDFAPIALFATAPIVLMVHPGVPAKTRSSARFTRPMGARSSPRSHSTSRRARPKNSRRI